MGRFIDYLKAHGRLSDLAFMSFEHYPYECPSSWSSLYREPQLIAHIMDVWRNDGVPANVPLLMTEGNMSWASGGMFPDIMGALWLADFEGSFFTAGGAGAYFFHYIPEPLWRGCDAGGGTFSALQLDKDYQLKGKLAQYFAAQMITQEWAQPKDSEHRLFLAASDVKDSAGHVLVTAYALHRPDGQWSLLLINKDHDHAHPVQVVFHDGDHAQFFSGPVTRITFGKAQYQWHPDRKKGHADPDGPPVRSTLTVERDTRYDLPPASLTILRGNVKSQ